MTTARLTTRTTVLRHGVCASRGSQSFLVLRTENVVTGCSYHTKHANQNHEMLSPDGTSRGPALTSDHDVLTPSILRCCRCLWAEYEAGGGKWGMHFHSHPSKIIRVPTCTPRPQRNFSGSMCTCLF